MMPKELRETIASGCNDVIFTVGNVSAGVTSEFKDGVSMFQAWYGDDIKYYDSVDDLMLDKFYGGKSLLCLSHSTDFSFV